MQLKYLDKLPSALVNYIYIIISLLKKKSSKDKTLPEITYVVDPIKVNKNNLRAYQQICDYPRDDLIPATYLIVLAQALQMRIMTKEKFPFAILGLIHISNKLKQYRKIKAEEKIRLSCQFGKITPHKKGSQFDFIINAYVDGEAVLLGTTTYLAIDRSLAKEESKKIKEIKENKVDEYQNKVTWKISDKVSRKYAFISKDINPIHLFKFTARLFGFKTLIAHGLWIKAKAIANFSNKLPASYAVETEFKLPVYLPATVDLYYNQSDKLIDGQLVNAKDNAPHLLIKINF